jgi:hypothetical protein
MGKIYTRFIALKKQAPKDCFADKVGLVKFEDDSKKYEIYFTRKRANKYSIIHCKNNTIEWEQFPVLPRIAGRRYGIREPIISIGSTKDCVRIIVILGKPNSIIGLDEGIFRSIHKYDENYVNVMSEARFKEL